MQQASRSAVETVNGVGYVSSMNADAKVTNDTRPVPPEVVEMAMRAVKEFPECFWWWNPDFVPETVEEVREVVLNLRKGGRKSWQRAQELSKCL